MDSATSKYTSGLFLSPNLLLLKILVDHWIFSLSFLFFLGVSKEKSKAYETQKNHGKFREQVSIGKYINEVQENAFINVKTWLLLNIVLSTFLKLVMKKI